MLLNGRYKKVGRIGEGSYGDVYKCIDYLPEAEGRKLPESTVQLIKSVASGYADISNDEYDDNLNDQFVDNDKYLKEEHKATELEEDKQHYVAIKKTKMRRMDYLKHSFNFSTFKEIVYLQELAHENIVKLIDIFYKDKSIYVVLEYMVGDLYQLIHKTKAQLLPEHVKWIMHQILNGLKFMHGHKLMHRDLKPGNLLISNEGIIKYSDFGLARYYDKEELKGKDTESAKLTRNVATRYYRPPEVLYGTYNYDFNIDIWSAGCIMGELVLGDFLFKGENEIDQLTKIFSTLGNAVEDNWPGVSDLPNYIEFDWKQDKDLDATFSDQTEDFKDLINKMLRLDPSQRISVDEALEHPYFKSEPKACDPSDLPLPTPEAEELDSFTDSD